ncbi:MAG: hypothetical protein GWP05_02430 [Anaerolineaceae bacterium]|nr:hypothetical protein [Anaerolineaceae bacterium]
MKTEWARRFALLLSLLATASFAAGCGDSPPPEGNGYPENVQKVRFREVTIGGQAVLRTDTDFQVMSTECRLITYTATRAQGQAAMAVALERLERIERALTRYNPKSELSVLNRSAGQGAMTVSATTGRAIAASKLLWRQSGGVFNPLVGRLIGLWEEADRQDREPTDQAIRAAMALLDMDKIEISREGDSYRVRLGLEGMALDLGGMAKGWAAQEVVDELRRREGVRAVLVMLGGDGTAWSSSGWPRPWKIGVQDPRKAVSRDLFTRVQVSNGSVVTSGGYYRYFEIGGRRLSHIIDPRNGRPTTGRAASVTVICPDGGTADGLATACMVLETDQALELLRGVPQAEGLILEIEGGKLLRHETKGFVEYEVRDQP